MVTRMRIDTHTHTAYSDGTDTPSQLMDKAATAGLDMIGLTDHDTTAGWDEAAACVSAVGVSLLRGAEFSCAVDGITVHMLGYLFNPHDAGINALFVQQMESREGRARRLVENLSHDYPLEWDDVTAFAPKGGPIGRPHIADALVQKGYFPDRAACFEIALHPRGPYYVHRESADARDVVRTIRAAGGVPVIAHPRAGKRQRLINVERIKEMAQCGLFGIERDHRDHDEAGRGEVDALAVELGLRIFGSSDYHGMGKPNQLGENLTAPDVVAALEEEGQLEVLRP